MKTMWIGKEREGKYKDVWTLFVASPTVTKIEIMKVLLSNPNLNQIYFGAGCCTEINQKVVNDCLETFDDMIITLEIDIEKINNYDWQMLKKINLILTVNHQNFNIIKSFKKENIQLKLQSIEDKTIMFINGSCFENVDTSTLGNKMYKGDKVVK